MKRSRLKHLLLLLALVICLLLPFAQHAHAEGQEPQVTEEETAAGDDKKLVITVVGDIPVADIDDMEAPMANPVKGGATNSFAGILPMIIIFVVAAGVVVILRVRYIRNKKALRMVLDTYEEYPEDEDQE